MYKKAKTDRISIVVFQGKGMNNDFFYSKNNPVPSSGKSSIIRERLGLVSSYMTKQYNEYQLSNQNTNIVFSEILNLGNEVVEILKKEFENKDIHPNGISFSTDSDRSVGILRILWHSISFTTRGNLKPQALYRQDDAPLFCGRIIALNGDFNSASVEAGNLEFPEILNCEMASLYIPAHKDKDAIMKIKHIGNIEYKINQSSAAREFLLKVIEIICGGGFYHEENFNE